MPTEYTTYLPHTAPGVDDGPGTVGLAEQEMRVALDIVNDVFEGTLRLRAEGTKYLPQFPKEEDEAYDLRKSQAVLYNAFKRTVNGLTGMVFRKAIGLGEDVPEIIAGSKNVLGFVENIDLAGRHLNVFVRDQFRDKTRDGHVCVLVDWKGDSTQFRTKSQEKAGGARPYWVQIRKAQVLRHEIETVDGEVVLVSFAYIEPEVVKEGEFTQKYILRVRQYDLFRPGDEARLPLSVARIAPTTFESPTPTELQDQQDPEVQAVFTAQQVVVRSWIKDLGTEGSGTGSGWEPENPRVLGDRMDEIPLVVDYGERRGYLLSAPPLLDLALENILHYQLRSDRNTGLHLSLRDLFVVLGIKAEDLQTVSVGGALGLALPEGGPEQDAKYVGAESRGLKEAKEELQDIEQRMASLGLAMLQRQTRSAETAEAKQIDKTEGDSELAASALGSQDSVEELFRITAKWCGLPDGGTVEVNTDFGVEPLDPQALKEFRELVKERLLSVETLWDMLEQGEMLPKTFDPEVERERLDDVEERDLRAAAEMARTMGSGAPDDEEEEEE
jgi:hypothetical protein